MRNPENSSKRGMTRFFIGVILVAAATLIIFEWKTFGGGVNDLGEVVLTDYEHEIIPIVVTKQPQQEMPPPSPNNDLLVIGDPDPKVVVKDPDPFIHPSDTFVVDSLEIDEPEPTTPPKVFVAVEKRPHFKECKDQIEEAARYQCTTEQIFAHFKRNKRYPAEMKKQKITGIVSVSFVVDEHGKVRDIVAKSRIKGGGLLEQEAKRLVQSLPKFIPAMQQGKAVRFKMGVPISFIIM